MLLCQDISKPPLPARASDVRGGRAANAGAAGASARLSDLPRSDADPGLPPRSAWRRQPGVVWDLTRRRATALPVSPRQVNLRDLPIPAASIPRRWRVRSFPPPAPADLSLTIVQWLATRHARGHRCSLRDRNGAGKFPRSDPATTGSVCWSSPAFAHRTRCGELKVE
jgi:hypothetical protein